MHFVKQDGGQVFKYAVRKMEELCIGLLEKHNLKPSDVKLLIPHQANRRIIMGVAERLGMDLEHVVINIDRFGNTTGATIPLGDSGCGGIGEIAKRGFGIVRGGGGGVYGGGEFVAVGILGSACLRMAVL